MRRAGSNSASSAAERRQRAKVCLTDQSTLEAIAHDLRAHAAEQSGYYLMSQDEFAELVRRGGYPVMPASA